MRALKKRLRKAARKLGKGDLSASVRALVTPHHSETRIETARAEVADYLRELHRNTVAHGPFKGMLLSETSYWGRHDTSAKILGTYERQVADRLAAFRNLGSLLVDIGSADGYFAVGALRAGYFAESICFESSPKGRQSLAANASRNGVGERIRVLGTATDREIREVVAPDRKGVVLCDIEGAEFDLLTDALFRHLSGMHFVIELHDFLVADGPRLRQDLTDRASRIFDVEFMRAADPTVSQFRELDHFGDDHRMLAFSEGRDAATEWMVLYPKAPDR